MEVIQSQNISLKLAMTPALEKKITSQFCSTSTISMKSIKSITRSQHSSLAHDYKSTKYQSINFMHCKIKYTI